MAPISRRNFMKAGAATAAGLSIALTSDAAPKGRALRIAHISDIHLDERQIAVDNFRKVLTEINAMKDKPDLIINTGDCVFAADKKTYEEAKIQWDLFDKMVKTYNKIPMIGCIGNHDVWYGPDAATDEQYKSNKLYYKGWVKSVLNMPERYYSTTQKGWHFIALDSINKDEFSIDPEQFSWLEAELNKVPEETPVCVFSHVSIVSIIPMMRGLIENTADNFKLPLWAMHKDSRQLKELFHKYPNVRLCLSGHTHQVDEVDFYGVKYVVGGAVSGNWWGNHGKASMLFDDFPPAYTIIDLYNDHTIGNVTVPYKYTS